MTLAPKSTRALAGAVCRGFAWRRGADLFLGVVVRASFTLVPGAQMVLTASRPIRDEADDAFHPSDLVPYRPHADVVVRGAPNTADPRHLRLDHGADILIDKRVVGESSTLWPAHAPAPMTRDGSGVLWVAPDLDWRALQCAPADQQSRFLRGGETLRLAGMDPNVPVTHFVLPTAHGRAFVAETNSEAWWALPMSCDLLAVDLTTRTAELSWRGAVQLDEARLRRAHVLGLLADGADHFDLPPVPTSSGLPARPPAHLLGVAVTDGTANLVDHCPTPNAGAPFDLKAAGPTVRGAGVVPNAATPWAARWPEPAPVSEVVSAPAAEPAPVSEGVAAPVARPEPTMEPAAPATPARWRQRDEAPLPEVPNAPKRPKVPNVRAMLYANKLDGGRSK